MAKKNLKVAANLLKMQYGYINGSHSENLSFDFVVGDGRIEVYNAGGKYDDSFYWPEEICKVAEVCGLSVHVSIKEIDDAEKVVLVLH